MHAGRVATRRLLALLVLGLLAPGCGSSPSKHATIHSRSGKVVFATAGCTGCHTLADAGSTATIGPDLDNALPSFALVKLQVTNGGGRMPSFAGKLKPAEIVAVARYVSRVAGKR